jgi:hypothetical protein
VRHHERRNRDAGRTEDVETSAAVQHSHLSQTRSVVPELVAGKTTQENGNAMSNVSKKATAWVTVIELNEAETNHLIELLKNDERDGVNHGYGERHTATKLGGQLRNVNSAKDPF